MIILNPGISPQSLSYIGRSNSGTVISLRDDQTNTTLIIDVAGEVLTFPNYNEITRVWSLLEGHTYELIIYNTADIGATLTAPIVFRGIIYCTAQDVSLNEPLTTTPVDTTEHSTDNKYTIYE